MYGINKAIIVGNLGKSPETHVFESGDKKVSFSVATSENWKDKNTGEKKEKTEWHNIVVFGKLADICEQYLQKGSKVYIEGKITTRKWQDSDGNDRYTTEIVANTMQMLDSKGSHNEPQRQPENTESLPDNAVPENQGGFDDGFDDSIPF